MVLANESVQDAPQGEGIPRVHEKPDAESLELLEEALRATVQEEPTPENLGVIAQRVKSDAVNYLILRSIPRALYSPQPGGHYDSPSRTTRISPP